MEVQEVAGRLLACSRLNHERKTEHRRVHKRSLDVNWHETIQDGQVYVSISSEDDDEQARGKQIPEVSNKQKRLQKPEVFTIDSSSEEEEDNDVVVEKNDQMKRNLKVLGVEEEEEQQQVQVVDEKRVTVAAMDGMEKKKKKQQRQVMARQNIVWDRYHVSGVRKRRLGEEDAAFLLFYGERETPSASILRLIVGLISTGVDVKNEIVSRFVEYLLWCKLRSTVEAGLASERLVQSEWTKIVFSCPVPPHRWRSGPMPRPDLLPRPITITVRPLHVARKRSQSHNMCVANSNSGTATKRTALSLCSTSEKTAVALANRLAGEGIQSRVRSPKKSMKAIQTKSPRGEVRKRPLSAPCSNGMTLSNVMNPGHDPVAFLPRKHQRRIDEVNLTSVAPRQVVRAKRPSGQSISQKHMEPLSFDIWTLGDNRSLPTGWRAPEHYGEQDPSKKLLMSDPVEVNPMFQMTADEISQHIASLRREGRFACFEKVTDILLKLMSDPRNRHGVFNTPVDSVALDLPTYTTIVQHPMDLGTIKRNLAAGEYLELEDFVSDVRLVFENAMLFNPETHYIHVDADILLKRFNQSVKVEQNRQSKRQRVEHMCLVCHGNTCIVCHQQCLEVALPNLQCSAGCSSEIRKGSIYFTSQDGTRVWCQKCKARMVRDCSSTYRAHNDDADALPASLMKKKVEPGVEPWVKCGECGRWLHQVCGLYNPVIGAYESQKSPNNTPPGGLSTKVNPYVCPLCRCRRKRATPPPKSMMRKILNADPDEHARNSSCLNIPSCELSIFIQNFLRHGLNEAGEYEAARTLYVRAVSFPGERMAVPERVVRTFNANSQLLAQLRPGTDTSSQRIPAHISYLSRGLYLFQKHEGMEVCLFTIYAQEFGDNCELQANRRAVYIAYLDSVRYLKPASARTAAYHLILLAYFDYLRRHGFSRVHIWSCPPQKRISYVFWCRPAFQKTPSSEHLRCWYNRVLVKAKERGIVKDWTTLYNRYFSDSVCDSAPGGNSELPTSFVSTKEKNGVGVSTRGTTVQSVNSEELVWPAKQLPPIFDGDIIPSELDRILGRIMSRNEKQKRSCQNKKLAAGNVNSVCACGDGKVSFGGTFPRIKEEISTALPLQVDATVREVFSRCQLAVQRLKQDLLVVNLKDLDDDEARDNGTIFAEQRKLEGCHPETLVPSWYGQVPRFFGSRFMFHQLCSYAGYQFDTLRRAKHSTMMMLHHYFNEQVVQLNVFCRECSLLITRADFWSCKSCARYALCDTCYWRQGNKHPHQLIFGPAPRWLLQISERPAPPVQPPHSILPQAKQVQSVKSKALFNTCGLC
ncbi:unnamed protein product [Peronospora belbahrii]|uniref:histone acetyltransferase n=1 Tax=Peronospora belbahrii TaxID=622444 RepID=A0AAU9KQD3_9STRA|nr:unnamed protein product [Peronospora belbahrii]CAH0517596.1 unnamed protein product [Peronospora belbahrii]